MSERLPLPFPGEILYWIACRAHVLAGNAHPSQTSVELVGNPNSLFCHDIPLNLEVLSRTTAGQLGTPREIVDAHTLIPYFTRFKAKDRDARARSLALTSAGPRS